MKYKFILMIAVCLAIVCQTNTSAKTLTKPTNPANTSEYNVMFRADQAKGTTGQDMTLTQGMDVVIEGTTDTTYPNVYRIQVGNMYPGGSFKVDAELVNIGSRNLEIDGILFRGPEVLGASKALFDELRIVTPKGNLKLTEKNLAYALGGTTIGQVINVGEAIPVAFEMKMNEGSLENRFEETATLQNTSTEFQLIVCFKAPTSGGGDGGGGGNNNNNNQTNPDVEPYDPTNPGDVTVEPDLDLEDGTIPAGPAPNELDEDNDEDVPDDKVPGSGFLPKTGGVLPIFFYGIGVGVLLVGLIMRRNRSRKAEDNLE